MKLYPLFRNKNFIDTLYVLLSSSLGQFLRIIRNIIVAGILGPKIFGTIQGLAIFILYIPIVQLGYFQASTRVIPQLLSAKENEKIKNIEYNGLSVALFAGVLSLIIYFCLFLWNYNELSKMEKICWIGFTTVIFMQPLGQFYQSLFTAHGLFRVLSKIKIIDSIIFFLMLATVYFWGYIAQLVSLGFSAVLVVVLMSKRLSIDLSINRKDLLLVKEFIHKGFPILLSALFFNIFFTIDRIFIIGINGIGQYGYYALGASFFQVVLFVPDGIRQISYRLFNIEFGKTKTDRNLNRNFWISLILVCFIMWSVSVLGYNILPILIYKLLPAYIPAINIVKAFTITIGFAAPGLILSTALYTIHKEKTVLKYYFYSILIFMIGVLFFIHYALPSYMMAIIITISHVFASVNMFFYLANSNDYKLEKIVFNRIVSLLSLLICLSFLFTFGFDAFIIKSTLMSTIIIVFVYLISIGTLLMWYYRRNKYLFA